MDVIEFLISSTVLVCLINIFLTFTIFKQENQRQKLLNSPFGIPFSYPFFFWLMFWSLIPFANLVVVVVLLKENFSLRQSNRSIKIFPVEKTRKQLHSIFSLLESHHFESDKRDVKKRKEIHLFEYLIQRIQIELDEKKLFPPPEPDVRQNQALRFIETQSDSIEDFYVLLSRVSVLTTEPRVEVVEAFYREHQGFFNAISELKKSDRVLLQQAEEKRKLDLEENELKQELLDTLKASKKAST